MHWRLTSILTVLALLGVVAVVSLERARPAATAAQRAGGARAIFAGANAVPVDEVDRVVLRRAGERPLVLVRSGEGPGGDWMQTEPFAHPMDPASVHRLVSGAAALAALDELDAADADAGAFGFDPARATLELAWPAGRTRLEFGRRAVAGRAFVRVDDRSATYVVAADLHDRAVTMDPKEWRDRRLFRGVGLEADRIEIAGAADVVLVRDRREWRLERPVRTSVNESAFDGLMRALAGARSGGFIVDEPGDLSRFGLEAPAATLSVTTTLRRDDGAGVVAVPETQRLLVGSRMGLSTEDRFGLVAGTPTVVRLPEAVLRALFPSVAQLVSPVPSGVRPADVKAIRIARAEGTVVLERRLEEWVVPDEDERRVPTETVDALLNALTSVRATNVTLAPWPRDRTHATVTLIGFDRRPLDTIRIAREGNGWVMDAGDDVLRSFDGSLVLPLDFEQAAQEFGPATP